MRNSAFWHFARRMLKRRGLAVGTLVFSVISAGGLASGLVSIGWVLELILGKDPAVNLSTITTKALADHPQFARFVPDALVSLLPADRLAGVAVILGALLLLTLVGALANFLHQYCSLTLSMVTASEIRLDAFRHALRLPLATVLRRGPAEIVSRVTRDTAELERGFSALTSKALAQVTKGVAAFAAAVWFDWRLTIVAVIVAPIMAAVLRKFGKRIVRGSRNTLKAYEDLLRNSNEAMQGLRGLKTATAERVARRRFASANRAVIREDRRVRLARSISTPLIEVMAIVAIMALALLAAHEILEGRMKFDNFLMSLASLGVAGGSLKPLTGLLNDIQASSAPAERILEIMAIPAEGMRERDLPELPRHRSSIEFKGVRFRYEGADRDALRGVDLNIAHGEFIAIVGPNGCGKTTLASLLVRLFDPTEGSVRIDGFDLEGVSLRSLRSQIGVVPQEPLLIRGSIRDNVTLGIDRVDEGALARAMELAHADRFVAALPQGIDTMLGEGGTGLSGGQRQRLAIARALVRDPSVLILDEATSQIDAESEAQISAAIDGFREGRTVIAIAHRLTTVRSADRIVVMDDGAVVDAGPHAELFGRCDLYRRLVQTQLVG
ncbi:MAG: ABC transporter ATP-binding protein [Planctomycetota bacterium]|jgi:ABC-type multidrug transport system fused ATPase/permease subunit|nr:ABC transporter ATP-binding protein [Planctomycetota bacterium]